MKSLTLIMTIIFLQSCATTYKCGEFPEGKCQTVSDVYKNSSKDTNIVELTEAKRNNSLTSYVAQPQDGSPILTQPKVLRVLFNKWMDKDGDLNLGGYMFIKIEDSKWQIQ